MSDPVAGRRLSDLSSIHRWLCLEVKAVEFTYEGELRQFARHGNMPFVAPGNLARHQERQCLAQFRAGGLIQQASS